MVFFRVRRRLSFIVYSGNDLNDFVVYRNVFCNSMEDIIKLLFMMKNSRFLPAWAWRRTSPPLLLTLEFFAYFPHHFNQFWKDIQSTVVSQCCLHPLRGICVWERSMINPQLCFQLLVLSSIQFILCVNGLNKVRTHGIIAYPVAGLCQTMAYHTRLSQEQRQWMDLFSLLLTGRGGSLWLQ